MRKVLIDRLKQDLIGPYSKDEILDVRPSDVYLTGILWPQKSRMNEEEEERLGLSGTEESEASGNAMEEEVSIVGLTRPSAAGVSFAARTEKGIVELRITVKFATYKPTKVDHRESDSEQEAKKKDKWQRHEHELFLDDITLQSKPQVIDLEEYGAPRGVKLHFRTEQWSKDYLITTTLLNLARPNKDARRKDLEQLTLFQARIEIRPQEGTTLVARPSRRTALDEDDRSAALLYRDAHEYATGHTCSAEWEPGSKTETASMVATNWIPTSPIPTTNPAGHKVFDSLRKNEKYKPLSTQWLATTEPSNLKNALQTLPAAYKTWIEDKENEVPQLSEEFRDQAQKNIAVCRKVHARMTAGIAGISRDANMSKAFQLANLAIDLQHSWNPEKNAQGPLEWRPFQLGFILLAVESVADRKHPEREVMDLLWFPTGGGKTEAYLALIAFLAFYRRLSAKGDPDTGGGVAAIMRYTLRLLTTQQFTRATSVLLACEAIRRGRVSGTSVSNRELGNTPFSIGLWVGREAVPNKVADAAEALGGSSGQPTPKQLVKCPACLKDLTWWHNEQEDSINVECENDECLLFDPEHPLPIWTVDDDVYRVRPTLLIGTIDKFAQIVRRKQVNTMFGLDAGHPPDLILQDELHLISGPLGTIAGLYEVAIDRMFSSEGARPKIIGSTATIQRAVDQVRSLFNRETAQFPPSCIDANDSAFSIIEHRASSRVYAGVTTAGRSAKFTLQAVAASLLQSASDRKRNDSERDPYWTLVSYFNSLRELGGALVLMQDDINDSLVNFAKLHGEEARDLKIIEELTSRRTQAEISDMLQRLACPAGHEGALDVVLATNMISVGIDIPRLGLMLVNGQPKGIAEYLQATSRVGRGDVSGLIVTVLNHSKARDRSRYESFSTWHETLYRDVEPTSVTPFASRARDRALHAVLVALTRHLVPGMLDRPKLDSNAVTAIEGLINDIVQRSTDIDSPETAVQKELKHLLNTWEHRAPESYWSPRSQQAEKSLLQDAERAATYRALGRMPGEAWPTLNSMRNVEPSTHFRLTEGLKTEHKNTTREQ